jgi:hypothetical protein
VITAKGLGRGSIVAKARGAGLVMPTLPLAPMVVVQLRNSAGHCWLANFSTPARNTRRAFASQSDQEY